jgi:hypothetical protein
MSGYFYMQYVQVPRRIVTDGWSFVCVSSRRNGSLMPADKNFEIDDLFRRAQIATMRIIQVGDDLALANEYKDVPRPLQTWTLRFSPSKRRALMKWDRAEKTRAEGPELLARAEIDLKEAKRLLRMRHRLQYEYTETPNGIRALLTRVGTGEVVRTTA